MNKKFTAYFAPEGFEKELEREIGDVHKTYGRLMIAKGDARPLMWAENIWHDVKEMEIASIGDAAKKLRAIQRNWICYSFENHRRAAMIQENLPHISGKPIEFLSELPKATLGNWILIDKNKILYSAKTSSPFPNGAVNFIENKKEPPNRAYLKLWEAFTLIGKHPKRGDICLDLGSSPGGWTWVLSKLGAKVISVDKAPLEKNIDKMPGVEFRKESAFGIEPEKTGKIDWLFSDIACYPERLLQYIDRWLKKGECKNFICTIKLQGKTDFELMKKFLEIPDSRIIHLFHNKHELTWIKLDNE